jgi:hypothetical protein
MAFSAGSVLTAAELNTFNPSSKVQVPSGSAASPPYTFDGDADTGVYRAASNSVAVSCGGEVRLTVGSGGLITMRSSADVGAGSVVASVIQIGEDASATNPGTNDYWSLLRRGDGVTMGSIKGTGSASVNFATTSDATLKTDNGLVTSERVGGIIDGLDVHDFDWIDGDVSDQIGLFAQEAIDVLPDTVVSPPGVEPGDDDGEPPRYLAASLDYSKIVPILLAECQFLRQRLNSLESSLATG